MNFHVLNRCNQCYNIRKPHSSYACIQANRMDAHSCNLTIEEITYGNNFV
jgi:hypothetical protein